MLNKISKTLMGSLMTLVLMGGLPMFAEASHVWGGYHWARTSNPFTLRLADNVGSQWDNYLATASADWTASSVLDTAVVPGSGNPKTCKPTAGRVEICNSKYGNNGWLGIASVWASGGHITQATVKMNDTYFNQARYNTPAWRDLVMCQEVGHTFGLAHQDEDFSNTNLDTCMDYTNLPDSNRQPNAHDYQQLEQIYAHLDSTTTVQATTAGASQNPASDNPSDWGQAMKHSASDKPLVYRKALGGDQELFTFVFWENGTHEDTH
jgi:hypothetical protein